MRCSELLDPQHRVPTVNGQRCLCAESRHYHGKPLNKTSAVSTPVRHPSSPPTDGSGSSVPTVSSGRCSTTAPNHHAPATTTPTPHSLPVSTPAVWKVFNDGSMETDPGKNNTKSAPAVVKDVVYFQGPKDELFRMQLARSSRGSASSRDTPAPHLTTRQRVTEHNLLTRQNFHSSRY
jgi:hypothetical protein